MKSEFVDRVVYLLMSPKDHEDLLEIGKGKQCTALIWDGETSCKKEAEKESKQLMQAKFL